MKRFLIEILVLLILQFIARIIAGLLGLQWDMWVYTIGAICGVLYCGLEKINF